MHGGNPEHMKSEMETEIQTHILVEGIAIENNDFSTNEGSTKMMQKRSDKCKTKGKNQHNMNFSIQTVNP